MSHVATRSASDSSSGTRRTPKTVDVAHVPHPNRGADGQLSKARLFWHAPPHLDDVDWAAWLHSQAGSACTQHDIRYQVTAAANRPRLKCKGCDRSVQFDPDVDFPCTGARPWLPHTSAESCTGRAKPIERTSTTAYYASVLSSLTIPVAGANNSTLLHALTDNATLRVMRRLPRSSDVVSEMAAVAMNLGIRTDDAEVTRHLDALNRDNVVGPRRADELTALLSADHRRRTTGAVPDLIVEPQDVEKYRGMNRPGFHAPSGFCDPAGLPVTSWE